MIKYDKTYDSHVHFFGVGLESIEWIIKDYPLNLPDHLKDQNFIRGFGLKASVTEEELNSFFHQYPNKDFCLSYEDGHSSLVSKRLIEKYSFTPQDDFKNHDHFISLYEVDRDQFLKRLPKRTKEQLKKMAVFSFDYFKKRGIEKVRHMTCTKEQWVVLKELFESDQPPSLSMECLFAEFMEQSLDEAFTNFEFARKNPIKGVSAQGIKLFVDGSISQKTAYMSSLPKPKSRLSFEDLYERMLTVLVKRKVPLALHTIGDLALEMSLKIYQSLSDEYGECEALHLEHAPIFTDESLDILSKTKLNCTFHFQPSHWIGDRKWYGENQHLLKNHKIYPFKELDALDYQYFMGSDAPIEESLVDLTEKGLNYIFETKEKYSLPSTKL